VFLLGVTETYDEHLKAIGLSLLLASTAIFIFWRRGFFSVPENNNQKVGLSVVEVIIPFALYLIIGLFTSTILIVVGISTGYVDSSSDSLHFSSSQQPWVNLFSFAVMAISLFIFCFFQQKKVMHIFFWSGVGSQKWKYFSRHFLLGAMSWLVSFPCVLLASNAAAFLTFLWTGPIDGLDQIAVKHLKSSMVEPLLFSITILFLSVIVPIMEEVLFRGYLQTWLRQYLKQIQSISITSFIFALFHYSSSQGAKNFELFSALFLLSCFLGYLRERQKNLWAPIGLHCIFNFMSIVSIYYLENYCL
jgi:membrane protease YdiL (CAAX protease family)